MSREQRRATRRKVAQSAIICDLGGTLISGCTVQDVSSTGARLALASEVEVPAEFVLHLSRTGTVRRLCRLVWRDGSMVGAVFVSAEEANLRNYLSD